MRMDTRTEIRLATRDDAKSISDLVSALGYPCTEAQMRKRLEALAAESGHATLVATVEGLVAGMIGAFVCRIHEEDAPVGQIITLSVGCTHRRQGLGRGLVQSAERWFRSQGVSVVLVNSGFERRDAHDFYDRLGYTPKAISFLKRLTG